ncbi:FtsX-like permease family protein [Actinomadura sp. ATCC 31491]|uniref:FtsX-like permease family protein n=1 Tax=Actinomadura luzonensis TaxID=2805427 RepID=A0ABT0G6U9_9ACTN|nr:FtsX-like permease family protein [Actinomadura luzonensis]MCK2220331.1 FtsX-like permease family protein [Actinomadura luzonensis]
MAVAARRAGRVRPAEAMREAAVEPRVMTPGRLLAGGGLLATAVISLLVNAFTDPAAATNDKTFMPVVMLLVAAAGLLAPLLVRPVARLLAVPLARLRGAGGLVVAAGALASTRRTAATAAPVLVTVALAATLLGGAALTDATGAATRTAPVRAAHLVLPTGTAGLDRQLVERLRAVPEADVTTAAETVLYTLEGEGTQLIRRTAEAVDPAALTRTLAVPVTAGSLPGLRDDTIAVSPTWELGLGERVTLWRADGGRVSLTVVALLGAGAPADAYVTPANAPAALPSAAYVVPRPSGVPGSGSAGLAAALRDAAAGHNARVVTRDVWAAEVAEGKASAGRLGLLAVLAIMLGYTVITMIGTLLMAAPDRAAEHGALRLLGATRAQLVRYAAGEALLVVAVGVLLAAAVTALGLLGLYAALLRLSGPVPFDVPWEAVAGVTALCGALAVAAAVVPASRVRGAAIPR